MYGKKEMIRDIIGGIFLFLSIIVMTILGFCMRGYQL